jgi:hypothetical protein
MMRLLVILPIIGAILISTPAFAEFPQPPLGCSLTEGDVEIYRFKLESISTRKHGLTERIQAQWHGCLQDVEYMFSYMRKGKEDLEGPGFFTLLTVRRNNGSHRELWRFRFGEKWTLKSCEFATYAGNSYEYSVEATDEDLREMETPVRTMLWDMMTGVQRHEENPPAVLARSDMGI